MQQITAQPFIKDPNPKHIRKDIETDPETFIKEKLTGSNFSFGVDEIIRTGRYKEMGYIYDLKEGLRRFLIHQHEDWRGIYALNKTNARKLTHGKVDEIVEIAKKN